jgi:hypothetical protein
LRTDALTRPEVNNNIRILLLTSGLVKATGKLKDAQTKLEQEEQYSRRDNLIISGILSTYSEQLEMIIVDIIIEKVLEFCNTVLDVIVGAVDITTAYRLKMRNASGCPPILVRFSRRIVRDNVSCAARAKLKVYSKDQELEHCIIVYKDLVDSAKKLLNAAREPRI